MARTSKKAKIVTVATVGQIANSEIRSVGEAVADVAAALPAPETDAVAAAETVSAPETGASGGTVFIPLNKLKKSPRNARKTPHSEADIEAYAASIAAKGILQNLVVEPELDAEGQPTGFYFVTIGEGRRLAQLLRAKRNEIRKTEVIRCVIDTANDPFEISLDENVTRTAMLGSVSQLSCWVRTAVMVVDDIRGAIRGRQVDVRVKRSRSVARTTLDAAAAPQAF